MDYSLLLVIEEESLLKLPTEMSLNFNDLDEPRNQVGRQHIGIIDYLQTFNFSIMGDKADGLSSSPSGIYKRRFMRFMEKQVFAEEEREDYYKWL